MTVPIAAMNKDNFFLRTKDKIWFAGQIFAMKPETKSQTPNGLPNS
jgi:hypothetical protein